VKITGSDDLISWALHKHPADIDAHDYSDPSILDADIIIHREGGVNKVVKGPDKGRVLTDWEWIDTKSSCYKYPGTATYKS